MGSKFVKLSEGTYLFGNGGVTRIEPIVKYDHEKSAYNTTLYAGITRIAVVKETEEEINQKLAEVGL